MIELLAALSASAAAGIRIALPLLLIGLLQRQSLWSSVPLLSRVPPPLMLGILVSWSLIELLLSKDRLARQVLQWVELAFSPVVGAIAGIAVARLTQADNRLLPLIGIVGGLLALLLQLVQVGWFYRLQAVPIWVIFVQDLLCVSLVLFAFDAPRQGGVVALLLLWLAIRSSREWQNWYRTRTAVGDRHND